MPGRRLGLQTHMGMAVARVHPDAAPTSAIPGLAITRYNGGFVGGVQEGPLSECPRYSVVDMTATKTSDLDSIKASSPSTKVIAYQDPTVCHATGTNPTSVGWTTPISYAEAIAHDNAQAGPNFDYWLLRDSVGTPITDTGFAGDYLANFGSVSYQTRALATMRATMSNNTHWDGFFWDNWNSKVHNPSATPQYATPATGGALAQLPQSQYQANMLAFSAAVGGALKNTDGRYIMGNAAVSADNDGTLTSAWWNHSDLYLNISAVANEFWPQSPTSGFPLYYNDLSTFLGHYDAWLDIVDTAQNNGMDFFCFGHGTSTDTTKMSYVKASFLLKWNGGGGGMFWRQSDAGNGSPWNDAYTAWLGTPSGTKFQVGTGWQRNYSGGTVIVNPNKPTGSDITFTLGGSYLTPQGTVVQSVTLTPVTSMILTTP